jgi:hypothetical protein
MNLFSRYEYVNNLEILIDKAQNLGLSEKYVIDAKEFIAHNEFELCIDTILENIYEYDIKVDLEFLEIVYKVLGVEKLDNKTYHDLVKKLTIKNN